MKWHQQIIGWLGLISGFFGTAALGSAPPNFVFIIADDCTHRDIGCYGGQAHTPNMDHLAEEGIRMTRCFQAAPMCSPTRHNIYTGLYPVKSGAYPNHTFVNDDVKSIVHYLKPAGYRLGLSGKTHINPRANFAFEYSGKNNNPDMAVLDRFFGECVKTQTPFCQFVCSNEPHTPWNKGDPSQYPVENIKLPSYFVDTPTTRQEFAKYLAEITYFDGQVGEVLALLKKHRLEENTLVMVVSEQGNSMPFAKWTVYDHGLQSAMIVRWPGQVKPATESAALVEYVDVLPTFLDAAGVPRPEILDGRSMLPVLRGETDHHKDFVFALQTSRGILQGPPHYGRRSVRSEQYKLIWNLDPSARFYNGIAKEAYFAEWEARAQAGDARARELVDRYFSPPEYEFFDVIKDPLEQHNLADDPASTEAMNILKKELADWMKAQGDQGQATELAAISRMTGGNADVKKARKEKPLSLNRVKNKTP